MWRELEELRRRTSHVQLTCKITLAPPPAVEEGDEDEYSGYVLVDFQLNPVAFSKITTVVPELS